MPFKKWPEALVRDTMAAGQGNVRAKNTPIRFDADGEEGIVDLLMELKEVRMGRAKASPDDSWIAALREYADARHGQQEGLHVKGR